MSNEVKCHECQFENEANAKFCSNCGNELAPRKENICKSCGFANKMEANYCATCGSKLSAKARNKSAASAANRKEPPRTSAPQRASKKPFNPIYVGAIIVGLFAIYLFIDGSKENASNSSETFQPSIERKTNNVQLENKVYEVASKFVCACGSCGEEPLESCTCQTAQQERQFIREALQQGQSADQVINAVNMNYGWIKDEYKSEYGNGKLNLDVDSKLSQLVGGEKEPVGQESEPIATIADRMEIISHFTCSCGQCDMDELKDCECDHPGGAQEVKQFIDEKIKRGIYTKEKIIEFVDHKYDNRVG